MSDKSGEVDNPGVALLPVGRELLTGRVQDSNSRYLAGRLFEIGLMVRRVCSVDDDIDAIAREIWRCKKDDVAVIITCGGLGPTPDDMTIRAVAYAMKREYRLDQDALEHVARRYRELHEAGRLSMQGMTPDREKMAWMPRGTKIIRNRVGTAPGADVRWGRIRVFCLPGVPAEMQAMADEYVLPELADLSGQVVRRVTVSFGVLDESSLAAVIRCLQPDHPDVHIKPDPKGFGRQRRMYVHFESEGKQEEVDSRLDAATAAFEESVKGLGKAT